MKPQISARAKVSQSQEMNLSITYNPVAITWSNDLVMAKSGHTVGCGSESVFPFTGNGIKLGI